jgi:hypothetical protein
MEGKIMARKQEQQAMDISKLSAKEALAFLAELEKRKEEFTKEIESETQELIGGFIDSLEKADIPYPENLYSYVSTIVKNYDSIPNGFNDTLNQVFSRDTGQAIESLAKQAIQQNFERIQRYIEVNGKTYICLVREKSTRKKKAEESKAEEQTTKTKKKEEKEEETKE